MESVERKSYKKYNDQDRKRVIDAAIKGADWTELATSLGISYNTAYNWVVNNKESTLKRGGCKPHILNQREIDDMMKWIEHNPSITLKTIQQQIWTVFQKTVSISTVGNTLHGRLYTFKSVHYQPENMNSITNLQKRAEYVRKLNEYIQAGKQVVFVDETNFNLFCRRRQGWSRVGSRAVQVLPTSRGPNIHLIGAISAAGVIQMNKKRGPFRSSDANEWMETVFRRWEELGHILCDLVVVCDNAPCHSKLEELFIDSPATLLRLAPYSPQLNPIENVWSKIKIHVKLNMGVPSVSAPNLGEQRLQYLENMVDHAKESITVGDCCRAIQHSTTFYHIALALEDMPVGT